MSDLPTIKCPYCEAEQKRTSWLCAHWNENLVGTCQQCEKQFYLRKGVTRKAAKR